MSMTQKVPRILLSLVAVGLAAMPTSAASQTCETSSPASLQYSVTVCISGPEPGASVTGDVPVSATVSSTGPNTTLAEWFLGSEYLLRDVERPYALVVPSAKFVDGEQSLSLRVVMSDGFTPKRPQLPLVLSNGVTSPPVNTNVFTPRTGTPGDDSLVVAATGDAAGGRAMAARVAQRIASWDPDMFLYLADVYDAGTFTEHYNHYGHNGSNFSSLRAITNPTVGNHEYKTPGAAGYFDYWDNVPHHYSVDAAGWHIVTIDSTTEYDQVDPGTPQYEWLTQDLADGGPCQLAFMHHPRFSVGGHGDNPVMDSVWRALAAAGVDILLTGHDHHYQRWTALDANGQPAPVGVTQFIAGAGGQSTRTFARTDSRVMTRLTGATAYGALRLTLQPGGATYQYVNVDGALTDAGSIDCDGPPPTTNFVFNGSGVAGKTRNHTFTIDRAGELTASLDWTNAKSDLNLALFNSAGTRLARATSTTQKPETITYALTPGTYRLAVSTRLADTKYTLEAVVRHEDAGPPPPTATISSPSAGAVVAETVPVAVAATSTTDATDELTVQVAIDDGAFQTAAYNITRDRHEYNWDSTTTADGNAVIHARATDSAGRTTNAADVTVNVDNQPDETTTYTFTGSGDPGSWRKHDFTVPAAGHLTATLDWDNTAADLNESLYSSAGTRIAYATGSSAKPEVIEHDVTAGSFRLGVGFKLASASYTLRVRVDPP